jgi:hypothetical protein
MTCLRLLPAILLPVMLLCGIQFPTRYERIENDRVRGIAFVFDNKTLAEASPGDTVTLHAYFAGERVSDIQWTVATQVISDIFAGDTFGDTVSLSTFMVPGRYQEYFGGNTDSAVMDFVIPADVIRKQFNNTSAVSSLIPSQAASLVPPSISSAPVSALLNVFDSTAAKIPNRIAELQNDSAYRWLASSLQSYGIGLAGIEPLLQIFSVSMKIFALVNGQYLKESTFTVRYNGKFHYLEPAIPVNRNPVINWIKVCRLEKGAKITFFDPLKDADMVDAVFPLDSINDSIPIDNGYRYFLVCDSAVASLDSGYSLTNGNVERENLMCRWFFRNEDPAAGVPLDSLMGIGQSSSNAVELLPPVDIRMQSFSLWLVGFDEFLGERLRPRGFTYLYRHGVFKYSEAYIKAHR